MTRQLPGMEDDFVDVDNVDNNAPSLLIPSDNRPAPPGARRSTRARAPVGTYATLRRKSLSPDGASRRLARSNVKSPRKKGTGKSGGAPKLKLKLGDRSSALNNSFLGPWDRELDSDDEDLAFEEQFILRLPEGEDLERLRKMVATRDVQDDVWFKFKGMFSSSEPSSLVCSKRSLDSRRANFHIGNTTYDAKLVDLPAIIESQKTLDNRQMFKVADICQMLVVENPVPDTNPDASGTASGAQNFDVKDFIWPHGITPPLRHVRKRRFRKRVNRAVCQNNSSVVACIITLRSRQSRQ